MESIIPSQKGVTIVELLVAIALLSILLAITVSFYPSVMRIWNSGQDTYNLRGELSQARDLMNNYLVKASTFTIINPGRIIFTANVDPTTPGAESCIFYLYNPSDAGWPSTYPFASYELRFMTYNGVPVFGSGRSLCYGINPPPSTNFSGVGNQIIVTLDETKNTQNLALRFEIHPRNL